MVVLLAALVFAAPGMEGGRAAESPDAETIVRRSVEVSTQNYKLLPHYNYFEVDHDPGGTSRTYEERMLYGSRYGRLVAINGQPLTPQRAAEEQRRLEATQAQRRSESPEERAKRVAGYERERQQDNLMLSEMGNAFDFTLIGEEKRDGHDVYVLKARPRKGYRPPNNRAKVLTGMEGTLWIEKNTFQWVRVEAQVLRPVSIEGFLARVETGTRFELEQMPVAENVWFPRHFSMKARARVFFFFTKADEDDETYYGYSPVAPES